jgi:hypothetical protein
MAAIVKIDNFTGQYTASYTIGQLWLTEAVTLGDGISIHWGDTTNPGTVQGESYRKCLASEDTYDFVGVAAQTTTAAGYTSVYLRGVVPVANVDSTAAVAIGDKLSIGATDGRLIEYIGTDPELRVVGVCLTTPSGNLASVLLYGHPKFISPS